MNQEKKFDVAIIGGGPAGMMAAIAASQVGAQVVLLEKNNQLGRKLLITGKGRCNLTQARHNVSEFITVLGLGKNGKFLYSALTGFGPEAVVKFFESKGLKTKVERGGRVFPRSNQSKDVTDILEECLKKQEVEVVFQAEVKNIVSEDNQIQFVELKNGKKIIATNYILATGGKSYPATGATGDGYDFAQKLGHSIIPVRPALVPLAVKEEWAKQLQGLSLKNVSLALVEDGKKTESRFGEMLFTHFGISGPIVLDLSRSAGEKLNQGEVKLAIDLKPALTEEQLDQRLQRDFEAYHQKDFKNYLPELLPQKMIEVFIQLCGIDAHRKIHSITREERKRLGLLLKNLELTATGLMSYNQAIVTTGGVDTKEVDSKTMRSKKISNLFFAGELLNLDGPTGGYNLQICWSTGFAAGRHAAEKSSTNIDNS